MFQDQVQHDSYIRNGSNNYYCRAYRNLRACLVYGRAPCTYCMYKAAFIMYVYCVNQFFFYKLYNKVFFPNWPTHHCTDSSVACPHAQSSSGGVGILISGVYEPATA